MKLGDIDGLGLVCGFGIGTLLVKYIELTYQIIIPIWMALPFFCSIFKDDWLWIEAYCQGRF